MELIHSYIYIYNWKKIKTCLARVCIPTSVSWLQPSKKKKKTKSQQEGGTIKKTNTKKKNSSLKKKKNC